jgi:hypothetical protein
MRALVIVCIFGRETGSPLQFGFLLGQSPFDFDYAQGCPDLKCAWFVTAFKATIKDCPYECGGYA